MESVIKFNHVSKKFRQEEALKDVTCEIFAGEIYGLIGKNGAGKTTLLKLLTGLLTPTTGEVALFSSSNRNEFLVSLKRTGSVIETPTAFPNLSARQNLSYYCKLRGVVEEKKAIQEALEMVSLADNNKKFKQFSLGMKQKLGIALALLTKPDILILDEPINGLDPLAIIEFRQLIKRLNQEYGMTIIISSHILGELYQVASKFGVLVNGGLVKEITKEEFLEQNEEYIVVKTAKAASVASMIADITKAKFKVVDDETIHIFLNEALIPQLVMAFGENLVPINEIYYSRSDLEGYFKELVTPGEEGAIC
ncbi:ABC-2 type transport system ATP-binding protein [Granulicatella balaenopterae]|uniref:ABC-2 type transport system ATP-binding protein n=1 Tax=Granulicatella balaenopterae TaxID=137733 RepID=A0A1H9H963_9LACT|nr:ATP-binding cassette domain-containing protein [Granulicatella balaenopterae]SEQ58872.1 ABC-2 type transport system ATP-binding protein [Granulicatella balaenopterae]